MNTTRIRIPCTECDGHGVYSIVNSMDPSAKLYDCEVCQGTGQAVCVVCGDPAIDHDDDGEPRCGHHLPVIDDDELAWRNAA